MNNEAFTYEPRSEITGLRSFRPGPTQTGLCSHRKQELRRGRYRTCIWWNNNSVQCRSSKKGSWCVLEECAKDNHYARFHTHSHRCCREMHFISRLNIKFWQSQWSVKCRSRAPGHGVCSKSVSSTITIQRFILPAITATEKCTLFLGWT